MGGKGSGRKHVPKPWEQQDDERASAFAAFACYRDLGAQRSLSKAAAQLGRTKRLLERWSLTYEWVKRCRAWDGEMDRRVREAEISELEKMRRRHIQLAVGLQTVGAKELKKLADAVEKGGRKLTVDQVMRIIEGGVKLERINRGEPTEHIQGSIVPWAELVKRAKLES